MTLFNKIKEITEIQATSGYEAPMRDYLRARMVELGYTPETDGLGGIFVTKESKTENAPRVMIAAHMDEVGFMVSSIKADGTLRVVTLGGWNPLVVSAQRFTLFTREGKKIPVVTGGLPPHLLRGAAGAPAMPQVEDIIFDGGFMSKEEVLEFGIRQGDVIVPESETILTANGKNVISKAWDNRYGCLMVLELLLSVRMFRKKLAFVVPMFQQLNLILKFSLPLTVLPQQILLETIMVALVKAHFFVITTQVISCFLA